MSFYLVYSSDITVAEVITCAYTLASVDKISDIALMLRSAIQRGFQESKALPWPPTPDNLATVDIPQELITFLNIVIARKPNVSSDKVHRLVLSIGQDFCRCVTGGDLKLPKHVFLCMTVRHLYRSKHLATILNTLGHCQSYDFGLELETAMAKALDETSTLLTPHIVKGEGIVLFHSERDNLNKILTNVHGHMSQQKSAHHPHLLGQGKEISLLIHPCLCQHCTSITGLDQPCPVVLHSHQKLIMRSSGKKL